MLISKCSLYCLKEVTYSLVLKRKNFLISVTFCFSETEFKILNVPDK